MGRTARRTPGRALYIRNWETRPTPKAYMYSRSNLTATHQPTMLPANDPSTAPNMPNSLEPSAPRIVAAINVTRNFSIFIVVSVYERYSTRVHSNLSLRPSPYMAVSGNGTVGDKQVCILISLFSL